MSKKRKTRKEKERAVRRQEEYTHQLQVSAPTYSISDISDKVAIKSPKATKDSTPTDTQNVAYLKKDILSIAAATGIILVFNIVLFILLQTGLLKLNFLGY